MGDEAQPDFRAGVIVRVIAAVGADDEDSWRDEPAALVGFDRRNGVLGLVCRRWPCGEEKVTVQTSAVTFLCGPLPVGEVAPRG